MSPEPSKSESVKPDNLPHKEEPSAEPPASSPPEIEAELTRWVASARTLDLLALPFDGGRHLSDLYDVALMTLMRKRWTPWRLFFLHYLLFAPVLEFPFWRPPLKISRMTLVGRFMVLGLAVYGLFTGLRRGLALADYGDLYPTAGLLLTCSLVFLHLFLAGDSFRYWREARARVHHHAPVRAVRKHKTRK